MPATGPGTNLHEDDRIAVTGDHVDLRAAEPDVAGEDLVAEPFEVTHGCVLGRAPECRARVGDAIGSGLA